jgi:hypothetical protein
MNNQGLADELAWPLSHLSRWSGIVTNAIRSRNGNLLSCRQDKDGTTS